MSPVAVSPAHPTYPSGRTRNSPVPYAPRAGPRTTGTASPTRGASTPSASSVQCGPRKASKSRTPATVPSGARSPARSAPSGARRVSAVRDDSR
ncbi:hypothetical protein SGRIM128S_06418 [Streptomyces griseomycini]